MATTPRLSPGDAAPDFTLPDADGKPVTLSDHRGQKVIVYVYPAAMTPGCTKQACDFRDSLQSLAAAGYVVLGISPDKPAKLAKFREKDGLTFPLAVRRGQAGAHRLGRVRREAVLRQDGHRGHPLHLRHRRGRQDRRRAVQRQGHRARRQTAPGTRRLRLGHAEAANP